MMNNSIVNQPPTQQQQQSTRKSELNKTRIHDSHDEQSSSVSPNNLNKPFCKNDYSSSNNTNDKLKYRYQLSNSPTSLKNETEFTTNNIDITTTENKHKLKQSKLVSKTKKDPSVRTLVENNTNNNMIEKTKIKYISNHKDREDIQIKRQK